MIELPKSYEPPAIEKKWVAFWEKENFFFANPSSKKPAYCIVIPPPNVTGRLHMGHALVNTLQDILIRWKRMEGFETLWVPGTDHAGIATQTVVERDLIKKTGKRRKEFSREEFLQHVWKWKEENQHHIVNQLKRLGCSCDWSRERFTMDEGNNKAVRTIFKKLYDDGLIEQNDYLVNWDPRTQTALADDEVEYEERKTSLWFIRYPLKNGDGFISIATTRPETLLGDTAIAVSPKDERYKHLIGKTVILPLISREILIVADTFVDPAFGTGAVKVTPAHDPNDYQIGLRHQLPFVNIMTPEGFINENGGPFKGLSMEEARIAVVDKLKQIGLLEKTEPYTNRVGVSYRSKAVIEPFLSKQWFVKTEQFKQKLKEAVTERKIKLIPKNWENTYFHWIDNLRDWCISRQLWWGHRIPIWYNKKNKELKICYDGEGLPPEVAKNPEEWIQEEDVLDTWFSSALWPFAALGWPEKTPELKKFYPNSVLVTGHDILFFWVARMIMMGEYVMGKVPFPEVFLHGLIYGKSYWKNHSDGTVSYISDKERIEYDLGKPLPKDVQSKWEKMSKTKGNIIDPLEMIDQFGTDAVRMALCSSAPQLREIDLDRRKFEEFKNFTNKVWNGARFVFLNLEGNAENKSTALTSMEFSQGLNESSLLLEDQWILSLLNRTIKEVNSQLSQYQFDGAALEAYDFFWKEFCAYYVEISKPILFGKEGTEEQRKNKQKILAIVLCASIRLLHPMAPFITEEIFHLLKERLPNINSNEQADVYTKETLFALQSKACLIAPYPKVFNEEGIKPEIEKIFSLVENVVYSLRNMRAEMKIPPSQAIDVYITAPEENATLQKIKNQLLIIKALVKINQIVLTNYSPAIGLASTSIVDGLKILVPLPNEMLNQEKNRLQKEKEKMEGTISKLQQQLGNTEFSAKAPKELVEKLTSQLQKAEQDLREINQKLQEI